MKNKIIKTFFLLSISQVASAQDVIVKKDGGTIISKVLEVNTADIKYKKFSNQNGPTYTINIADVMTINYENGDKDTFSIPSNTTVTPQPAQIVAPSVDYGKLAEENLSLVRDFNSHDVEYIENDVGKKAGAIMCTIGIKEGSVIETPELKASFKMKKKFKKYSRFSGKETGASRIGEFTEEGKENEYRYNVIAVTLKNKTDKTIFLDLGTSYFVKGEESIPYYIPTSTTTSTGSSSVGSVNMGSVAGALGVGGTVGTLAGGVNVGGGSSSTTSTTTYSQRVISIAPMASMSLEPQEIGNIVEHTYFNYFMEKGMVEKKGSYDEIRFEGLKRGEKIDIPQMEGITPLSVYVSYAFDEMISQPQTMRVDFFWRQILGIKNWDFDLWSSIDISKCPLIFRDTNPMKVNWR